MSTQAGPISARCKRARGARRFVPIAVAVVVLLGTNAGAASSSWTIVASPSPAKTDQTFLDGAACAASSAARSVAPSPATCFGVGSYLTSTGHVRGLIERWRGSGWTVAPSADKPGALVTALVAVACAKPTSCLAVGNTRESAASPTATLSERWNGTRWSIVASAQPRGATGAYLNSVSCTSATNCDAVGSFTSAYSSVSSLVEHWNGSRWSIVPSPNAPHASSTVLNGVSCTGAATVTCWAVGSYATSPTGNPFFTVTERMQHGKWTIVASPNVKATHPSALNAVSCTGATSCTAVGVWQHGFGATLVEHWNGAHWAVVPSANPPRFTFSQLVGVSCVSATSCVAAGTYASGTPSDSTLIERWNGSRWTVDTSPNPSNGQTSSLAAVACAGASRCFAVGTYLTKAFGNPASGFTEHHA